MTVVPVIGRELRAQARQPLTYWLRIIGGLSIAAAFLAAWWHMEQDRAFFATAARWRGFYRSIPRGPSPFEAFGTALFGNINLLIVCAIWLFVPLSAADAISRERREGTLPLLFLTRLSSSGIVLGKACAHILRSFSLFVTMAPWLMLPVLFGGVAIKDVQIALTLDVAAILLAMSAGLLATTWPRDWLRSVILAEFLALFFLLLLLHGHEAVLRDALNVGTPASLPGSWQGRLGYNRWEVIAPASQTGWIEWFQAALALTTNWSRPDQWQGGFGMASGSSWAALWTRMTPAGHHAWIIGCIALVLGSGLLFFVTILIGASRIQSSWRDTGEAFHSTELKQQFFAPRYLAPFLHQRLSRALSANPIGWLQVYSPSARLIKWGWCLFIILIEILLSGNSDDLYGAQRAFGLLLLLGMTFSATASFRQELATGAFELWLVTPLRERQIIAGRVRGLWKQFLPALLVYAAGGIYLASGWNDNVRAVEAWTSLARMLAGFCAMPLLGLYFAIMRWNFFTSWLVAGLVGLGLPGLVRALGATETFRIIFQLGLGAMAGVFLYQRLRKREFLLALTHR